MAQMKVPEAPREYATQYHNLLGVDYQADQTEVDRRRSPDMVNMVSDFGGNPIKRDGFRAVGDGYSSLLTIDGDMYGVRNTSLLLSFTKLRLNGYTFETLDTYRVQKDVGTIKSVFTFQKYIFVIATKAIVRYDTVGRSHEMVGIGDGMMSQQTVGESAPCFSGNIPTTVITVLPDGTGGVVLDDKNIFSIYQTVTYQGDGNSTNYTIPNYTKIGTWVKAEVKNATTGDWEEVTVSIGASSPMTGKTLDGASTMTNNVVAPSVTFATAPPAVGRDNADNVRITFAPYSTEKDTDGTTNLGYYNQALVSLLSSVATTFQNGRMFTADKYKVYYSNVNDPLFISDLSWFDVDSEIMCFTRTTSHIAIITKDSGLNTIFLADEATRTVDSQTGETETYFQVKASNAGVGAISSKCIGILSDEPLFLSSTGLFGILSNWQSEKYVINRSSRVNRRLCKEKNLETAVGIAWNDYFYLALNGHMYVFDGRHKENDKAGNKPLEAYFFDHLPIVTDMYAVNDKMYFTDGEKTYTWNNDLPEIEKYYDNGHVITAEVVQYQAGTSADIAPTGEWLDEPPTLEEGEYMWYSVRYDDNSIEATTIETVVGDEKWTGQPVCARWCTVYDDDGAPQKLKTYMKKGSMITIQPHYKSGCEITLAKDGDVFEYLGKFHADMQTFDMIDFSRFTFSSNAVVFDKFTKKKIKKYKRLQIQVENNNPEPFGITKIVKTYTIGNYAKR